MDSFGMGFGYGVLVGTVGLVFVFLIVRQVLNHYVASLRQRDDLIHALHRECTALNVEAAIAKTEANRLKSDVTRLKTKAVPAIDENGEIHSTVEIVGPTTEAVRRIAEGLRVGTIRPDEVHGRAAVVLDATGALARAGLKYCAEHDHVNRVDLACPECARDEQAKAKLA